MESRVKLESLGFRGNFETVEGESEVMELSGMAGEIGRMQLGFGDGVFRGSLERDGGGVWEEDEFQEDKFQRDKFQEDKFKDKFQKDKFQEDKFQEYKFQKDKFQEDKFQDKFQKDKFQEDKFQEFKFQKDKFQEDKFYKDKFHRDKFQEYKFQEDKFQKDKLQEYKFQEDKFQEDKFQEDLLEHETAVSLRSEKSNGSTRTVSKSDHVYEEVTGIKEQPLLEYDILDYYEKYSPTTARTLINTLFLPRHKICKQCASLQTSPVYTDSLIYLKESLYAREVRLVHQDSLSFKYSPLNPEDSPPLFLQYEKNEPCMLVHSHLKTNASSIFYSHGSSTEVFDLKATLKPHILLLTKGTTQTPNTELYHRSVNNAYRRVSNNGTPVMTFRVDHENILTSIKHVGYDTDLQNWMNYRNDIYHTRNSKQEDTIEHRANRSSLLLLEPLLLMPELTRPRYGQGKNRISQSEHVKIVKIVVAYTLSFVILASITFYIVYFT